LLVPLLVHKAVCNDICRHWTRFSGS